MIQRREQPSLALEPLLRFGIEAPLVGQDLERDLAPEPRVARPIDFPHAAGPG